MNVKYKVALLHGAGYAGGELIKILLQHPEIQLAAVTSRSFAGKPLWHAHPAVRGQTEMVFEDPESCHIPDFDGILVAGEHGQSAALLGQWIHAGYQGKVVDLSADFRLNDAASYNSWYGYTHPYPELLETFVYGIPEIYAPYPAGTQCIANPGCFATGISLALWPLAQHLPESLISVTAFTGASGSGARPKPTTHYPTRDGNVRAYKVLNHQHLPEIHNVLNHRHTLAFIPVSGPWTRGIWGTAHVQLPDTVQNSDVASWYNSAYGSSSLIRLWPDDLPELRYAAHSPFADIGWLVRGRELVIGFAIDNLLKGAASQAIQNMNLLFGIPEITGLIPSTVSNFVD